MGTDDLQEVDLVFRIDDSIPYDERFLWSYDGGKNWRSTWLDNEFAQMIQAQIGRFIVDEICDPRLAEGEELCYICRDKGQVGIMRFHRYESGTEKIAQVWCEEGVEVSGDVAYGVRYRIVRCDRCGKEDSDYG